MSPTAGVTMSPHRFAGGNIDHGQRRIVLLNTRMSQQSFLLIRRCRSLPAE